MQLWVHSPNAVTGNAGGFMDVRPDADALALITAGEAHRAGGPFEPVTPPTNPGWKGNGAFHSTSAPPPVAPTVTTAPSIAGATAVGSVLTCTPGVYAGTPTPTITRQWKAAGTNIAGATALTYTTVAGDSGKAITCVETATNSAGSVPSTSNAITVA